MTYLKKLEAIQITILSLSTVVLNSRDRQGNVWLQQKCTWINSSVIVSTEKQVIRTSTGTTLSTLKSILDAY